MPYQLEANCLKLPFQGYKATQVITDWFGTPRSYSREPLSKTGLSGLQAAGRLQGPEVGPESAVAVESGVSQAL